MPRVGDVFADVRDNGRTMRISYHEDRNQFHVAGTHTYDRSGTYTIAVHVRDAWGAEADGTGRAEVGTGEVDDQLAGQGVIVRATAGTAFTGPLVALDQLLGGWIGDRILAWKFPPEKEGR